MKFSMSSNSYRKAFFVIFLIFIFSTLSLARVVYKDGKVVFTFQAQANVVYLAGTFNNWSPTAWAMKLVDGVWTYEAELKPGTYQYKFVIDGKTWKEDPEAPAYVDDGFGGKNGIFTLTDDGKIVAPEGTTQAQTQQGGKKYILNEKRENTIFVDADGYVIIRYYNKDAKQPFIAGSFNNWKADESALYFVEDGWWEAVLELQPGIYEYKFIVDGNWIADPNAFAYTDDGFGGVNAVIEVAREGGKLVVRAPEGAVKEEKEKQVTKAEEKSAVVTTKAGPGLSIVEGKVYFAVKKENTQEAYLAGSFNGWNPRAQKMQLVDGYWTTTLALQPGVHKYKFVFVIGGNDVWEEDPLAPAYEPDGYGGKNGVFKLLEKDGKLAIEGVESQGGGLPVKGKYEFTYSFSTDSNKILVFTGATNKLTLTFNPNSDLTLSIAYGGASIDNALFKLTNDKLTIGFHYKSAWDFPVTGKDTGIVFSYDIAKNTKFVFGLGYENSELPLVAGVKFGGLSVYGAKGYFTNDYSVLAQYSLEVPFTLLLTGMYSLDNTYYFRFDFGTEQLALGAGFDGAIMDFYASSRISTYDVLLQGKLDLQRSDLTLDVTAKADTYKFGLGYKLSTQTISLSAGTFDKEKELNLKVSFDNLSDIPNSTKLTLSGAVKF